MVTTSWQLTCAGSRAEVMALLSDVTRYAEWMPAMRSASKTTAGPIASGTEFDSVMDLGGRATPVAWKVKKFEPPLVLVLKGKAKYDAKQWYWPAKIKGACCRQAPRGERAPQCRVRNGFACVPRCALDNAVLRDALTPAYAIARS